MQCIFLQYTYVRNQSVISWIDFLNIAITLDTMVVQLNRLVSMNFTSKRNCDDYIATILICFRA